MCKIKLNLTNFRSVHWTVTKTNVLKPQIQLHKLNDHNFTQLFMHFIRLLRSITNANGAKLWRQYKGLRGGEGKTRIRFVFAFVALLNFFLFILRRTNNKRFVTTEDSLKFV